MLKRIASALIGLALLLIVYQLGVKSLHDTNYVLWFGLASAIAAPVGLGLIGYSLKRGDVLPELAKIPEIAKLTQEAKSQEEKVAALEKQRAKLVEIIRYEARKQALENRKELLESDAARILEELNLIEQEMSQLNLSVESSEFSEEVRLLQKRIEAKKKGEVIIQIGSYYFTLNRYVFNGLPFPIDVLLLEGVRLIGTLSQKLLTPKPPKSSDN